MTSMRRPVSRCMDAAGMPPTSLADGVFSRALDIGGKTVALSVRSVGEVERPRIEARLVGDRLNSEEESQAVGLAVRLVGAQGSRIEFYDCIEDDDPMAEFTGRFRGLGIAQSASPFEGLVLSILGQQISNEVARVLRDLLVDTGWGKWSPLKV